HISFHPRYESHEHLVRLYNQADCFVTLSKAEGFNLEALEAMACGTHVIGTNYSGHTEFMNENNTLLVNPVGMELANDGKWFNGQGEWAVFSTDEIVERLRATYTQKVENHINMNGIKTAKQFTWDASVVELEKAL